MFHVGLSIYLFFLSEILQKRFHTRQLTQALGLLNTTPKIGLFLIITLLLFLGLPLTIKFYLEIALLLKLHTFYHLLIIVFIIII